jgi:hypothetical protein
MRSPSRRLGLLTSLSIVAAVAVVAATAGVANAQFRLNSFNNMSAGPRAPMMTGPSFRNDQGFRRFNNNIPKDVVVTRGKGKGKGKGSNTDVSVSNGGDGKPPRHPPRGPRPPHHGPGFGPGPIIGTGVATGVIVGTPGPAGAGTSPPTGSTVAQRNGVTIPPANETRFVRNEVVLRFVSNFPAPGIDQVLRRHRLVLLESQVFTLTNSIYVRARIGDRRSARQVLSELGRETSPLAIQVNYLYRTSQETATPKATLAVATAAPLLAMGDPAQYALAKLHINEAHRLATGDKVLVAVIDSGVDLSHPELQGVIAGSFDALGKREPPHMHGTAIAGAIAAHARLMGAAPAARILAIRAFGNSGASAEATTFAILKGVEYAVAQHARVINMSFAGPSDPALQLALGSAKERGTVLVAASGNFGPKSPVQYPAGYAGVIAVSATDANDDLFTTSNIGPHIAVAAPGVDILLPVPNRGYETISGTSFSAAYVSGVAALVIQRAPGLSPDAVRHILESTAKDLGPRGKDSEFGAGLVDAYQAIMAVQAKASGAAPQEVSQQVSPQALPPQQ